MSGSMSRRRVPLACTACRSKKARCDGELPVCSRCREKAYECSYDHQADRRKPPSKRYVEALLSRIGILERELNQFRPVQATASEARLVKRATQVPQPPVHSPETSELIHDLTQLYGHLDIAEDGYLRYFGAPSYFNLLRRPQYHPRAAGSDDSTDPEHEYHDISSGLAPDEQAELLDHFWRWQNSWQYLIHRRIFCEGLEGGIYTTYCTPLLLQCILALAARYSDREELRDSPDELDTAGNALAEQAKAILHFELETPTTSTVASLGILALREMSINREALGWTYVGMAIRIAYNLGLNHDCTQWVQQGKITQDEAEIRKITWWGCYLLDKLFVMALGRPGMIAQRDINVTKPSLLQEMEYDSWSDGSSNSNIRISVSRCLSNFNAATEIFQMASHALEEIYAPNSSLALSAKEALATATYVEVSRFHNDLPGFLRIPPSPKTPLPAHIYSLHLQYLVIVILLHRPFLRSNEEFSEGYKKICWDAAGQVTAIMRAYRAHYSLRRIPISTIHAVGTASIIQLLAATSQDSTIAPAAARLLKYNIMCLHEMSQAWTWSLRAIRSLQILAEDWYPSLSRIGDAETPPPDVHNTPNHTTLPEPDDGVLDWLMDLENTEPFPEGSLIFDQHLWPVGFSHDY